jgi:hypothetical protein
MLVPIVAGVAVTAGAVALLVHAFRVRADFQRRTAADLSKR